MIRDRPAAALKRRHASTRLAATLGNGLAGTVHGGRAAYLTYVTVEVASNAPMFLMVLPFLGSGFVPTSSMPGAIRWFTEYQPFTPAIQTLRGLLLSAPIGANAIIAIAWSTGITLASYLWARKLFSRDPSRN